MLKRLNTNNICSTVNVLYVHFSGVCGSAHTCRTEWKAIERRCWIKTDFNTNSYTQQLTDTVFFFFSQNSRLFERLILDGWACLLTGLQVKEWRHCMPASILGLYWMSHTLLLLSGQLNMYARCYKMAFWIQSLFPFSPSSFFSTSFCLHS